MVQVNPASRPDADDIVDEIDKLGKYNRLGTPRGNSPFSKSVGSKNLLNTIELPEDMKWIQGILPKAKYERKRNNQMVKYSFDESRRENALPELGRKPKAASTRQKSPLPKNRLIKSSEIEEVDEILKKKRKELEKILNRYELRGKSAKTSNSRKQNRSVEAHESRHQKSLTEPNEASEHPQHQHSSHQLSQEEETTLDKAYLQEYASESKKDLKSSKKDLDQIELTESYEMKQKESNREGNLPKEVKKELRITEEDEDEMKEFEKLEKEVLKDDLQGVKISQGKLKPPAPDRQLASIIEEAPQRERSAISKSPIKMSRDNERSAPLNSRSYSPVPNSRSNLKAPPNPLTEVERDRYLNRAAREHSYENPRLKMVTKPKDQLYRYLLRGAGRPGQEYSDMIPEGSSNHNPKLADGSSRKRNQVPNSKYGKLPALLLGGGGAGKDGRHMLRAPARVVSSNYHDYQNELRRQSPHPSPPMYRPNYNKPEWWG